MRDRRKRNILIGSLCCLLVFMGVGYALLSQNLNLAGNSNLVGVWDVVIIEATKINEVGRGTGTEATVNGASINFTTTLYMPGDSVEYSVTVENQGNINAKLLTTQGFPQSEYVKYTITGLSEGDILVGDSESSARKKTFTIKVEIPTNITSLPSSDDTVARGVTADLSFIFEQTIDEPIIIEDPNALCYTVNGNGVLTKYNYDCGTEVSLPAEVNGVALKEISTDAFSNYNVVMFAGSGEDYGYQYDVYYITRGLTDEEINGIKDNLFPYLCKSSTTGEVVQSCVDDMIAGTIKSEDLTDEEYAGFEAAFVKEYIYIDTSTYTPGTVTHYATTLDLSGATNLEAIRYGAFANADGNGSLTSINFGNIQSLTTIEDYAFVGNKLTNAEVSPLPASLTTLSTTAFASNSGLTQLTLTSASDISGWANGSNVNGITVTYQR